MNIDAILNGKQPTLDEYAEFVGVCKKLPRESLWKIITDYPHLHIFLRNEATYQLREKIHQANKDRFNEDLLKIFTDRLT